MKSILAAGIVLIATGVMVQKVKPKSGPASIGLMSDGLIPLQGTASPPPPRSFAPEPEVDEAQIGKLYLSAADLFRTLPSAILARKLSKLSAHYITDRIDSTTPSFIYQHPIHDEAKDVTRHLHIADSGPGWTLLCSRNATILTAVSGSKPSHPRCIIHKSQCATDFKVFAYPAHTGGERPVGQFYNESRNALLRPKLQPFMTNNASEACLFVLGVDTFMFGNAPGALLNINGTDLIQNTSHYVKPEAYSEWIGPPSSSSSGDRFLKEGISPNRTLWGLNHLATSLSDWQTDEERSYDLHGMLPIRTTTADVTYQKWIDTQVPAPKIVQPTRTHLIASDKRPGLMFFAGSVYSFRSSRYSMRLLRDLGSPEEIRVWTYCYDKTKKGVRIGRRGKRVVGGKWGRMKTQCAPETDRSGGAGLLPTFKTRSTKTNFMPPETFGGATAELYATEMQGSTFCLVARGWALHNYRLTEALYFGCIPVLFVPGNVTLEQNDETYIAKMPIRMVLPFEGRYDWSKFIVVLSEDLLYSPEGRQEVVDKLRAMKSTAAVQEMQVQGVLAHDRFHGGDTLAQSMVVMMQQVFAGYQYRATVFEEAIRTLKEEMMR